jgi:hypothetical protein
MRHAKIAGFGRKRPQLNIAVEKLHLDSKNPRLPEEWQTKDEKQLVRILYEHFKLDELAESMARNGYFDEEPLIATPRDLPDDLKQPSNDKAKGDKYEAFIKADTTSFTVVEGNRRLATVKLLLDAQLRSEIKVARDFPQVKPEVVDDLGILPVIVYPHRAEVIPYLGVRHIIGVEKWDSYAKARYLAKMIESGSSVKQVQSQIGDVHNAVLKSYACYRLLEQAKNDLDYNTKSAKNDFSLLMVALNQKNIKQFLGLPTRLAQINFESPVSDDKLESLHDLLVYIFGDGERQPAITDSRQIPKLGRILANQEAALHLKRSNSLFEAYDRTGGEEEMVNNYLFEANRKMEMALGVVHRHRTPEVIEGARKCADTASALLEVVSNHDD